MLYDELMDTIQYVEEEPAASGSKYPDQEAEAAATKADSNFESDEAAATNADLNFEFADVPATKADLTFESDEAAATNADLNFEVDEAAATYADLTFDVASEEDTEEDLSNDESALAAPAIESAAQNTVRKPTSRNYYLKLWVNGTETNWEQHIEDMHNAGTLKYAAYTLIKCPETHMDYYEVFCAFTRTASATQVQTRFVGCHAEAMFGRFNTNEQYLAKKHILKEIGFKFQSAEDIRGYKGPPCQTAEEQHSLHRESGKLQGTVYDQPWTGLSLTYRNSYKVSLFKNPAREGMTVSFLKILLLTYKRACQFGCKSVFDD